MFKTCKKPPMSIISASGSICTFNALQEGLPLKSCVVDFEDETGIDSLDFSATGKNLFNKDNCIKGYLKQDGSIGVDIYWRVSEYIPVLAGVYCSSGLSSSGSETYICIYDSDKTLIKSILIIARRPNIIEIETNGYIRLSIRIGELNTAQLEKNNEPTDYQSFGDAKLFSFGKTIQNGSLNILTGELTNNDTTPPEVINLGGMNISLLQGVNNIFADTGNTSLEAIKIGR